jgi:glycosidase
MHIPKSPSLYQVNTRVWLTELSNKLGRKANLDDIPDEELDKLASYGFDWIWLLSVWQTGETGQRVSRHHHGWRKEFEETLQDLREEDIAGSGFAITSYNVHENLGGESSLANLRNRLKKRGIKLMLDFVPNHSAIDHEWVYGNPDFFISGSETDIEREPQNYIRVNCIRGEVILAHGRDPYFPGWPDTLQLNYGNDALQIAMMEELIKIARQCDGVRCDMAMLVLPEVFERTWGIACKPFWPEAIHGVHELNPAFCFMAEVYWDLEWTIVQQGFDYAYDKRLYDRLKEGHARPVREHFFAGPDYQERMARFLENHDEPRVAAEFPAVMHEAAAILTFLSPGLRFFHQGQLEGRKKRISPHLVRAPEETVNHKLDVFYHKLLALIRQSVFREGNWQLLSCTPAWEGNWTNDCYIAFSWDSAAGEKRLVAVNYSPFQCQCYIKIPLPDPGDHSWVLHDLISGTVFERNGNELREKGLFLDEPAWKFYVFSLK